MLKDSCITLIFPFLSVFLIWFINQIIDFQIYVYEDKCASKTILISLLFYITCTTSVANENIDLNQIVPVI